MPLISPPNRALQIKTPTAPRAPQRPRRRRAHSAWVLAVLGAVLLCALAASSARAGTYDVYVCGIGDGSAGTGSGLTVSSSPGSYGYMDGFNFCASPSPSLFAHAYVPAGGYTAWTWDGDIRYWLSAPANTSIESVTLTRTFSGMQGYFTWDFQTPDGGLVERSGVWGGASAVSGTRTYTVNASYVTGHFFCALSSCSGTGTSVTITNLRPRLSDTSSPTFNSTPSGSLFDPGAVSGTRGALFDASDLGGGVYRTALLVDGVENQSMFPNTNGGRCVRPFQYVVPCLARVTGTYFVNTRLMPEGQHQVQLAVYDATDSNRVVSAPKTVTIDNIPAPSGGVPTISGATIDGQQLTADPGVWQSQTGAFTYAWLRCSSTGVNCSPVSGATSSTYTLGVTDVGQTVRVRVTAANSAGETTQATSDATAVIAPRLPAMIAAPTVAGTAQVGQQLSGSTGRWSGTPTITYAYRWLRCDQLALCTPIAGATAPTYTPGGDDVGMGLRVEVTATNGAGSVSAQSASTTLVPAIAPTSTDAPSISGSPRDRLTLTADDGSFDGAPAPAITRVWERCDQDGCTAIGGASGSTYTLGAEDVGFTLRVAVTATNAAGSVTVRSASSAPVQAMAPVALEDPSVTGPGIEGVALAGHPGLWDGTPDISYAYAWSRCDDLGADCTLLDDATQAGYVPGPDDVDHRLRLTVTASNAAGPVAASSALTPLIAARAPVSSSAPTIDGDVAAGETLTASTGGWEGTQPLAYAYAWSSCQPDGETCVAIPDATSSSYRLRTADVGRSVRVAVTARNVAGERTATSAATVEVPPVAPSSTGAPALAGDAVDGATLQADDGTFAGTPTPAITRVWERCDQDGCTPIDGASSSTYALGAADVGMTIQIAVTARNRGGEVTARSAATAVVAAAAPRASEAPAILGTGTEGVALTAQPGQWSGTAPIVRTLAWMRCSATGEPESCSEIGGATDASYVPDPADIGHRVRLQVTATNAGGQTVRLSEPTRPILPRAPANATSPTIAGETTDGQTLTAATGTWTGTPEITTQLVWLRCNASGGQCASVAHGAEYELGGEDVGHTMRVRVRASNMADETTAVSAPSALVLARAPDSVSSPQLEVAPDAVLTLGPPRTVRPDATLSVAGDRWDGTGELDYAPSWERCTTAQADDCEKIPNANARTYHLSPADAGTAVRAEILATNAAGTATAQTAPVLVERAPPADQPGSAATPAPAGRMQTLLRAGSTTTRCSSLLRRVVAAGPGALRVDGALDATTRIRAGRHALLTLSVHGDQIAFKQGARIVARAAGVQGLRWTQRGAGRLVLQSEDDRLLVAVGRNAHHSDLVAVKVRLCTASTPARERLRVLAGRAREVILTLTTATGGPIQRAVLRVDDVTDDMKVRTDDQGVARLHLRAGGSRSLGVSFDGDATRAPATLELPVDVAATTTLTLVSGSVPASGGVVFAGRLRGDVGDPSGTRVQLAYRSPDGTWHGAGTARVDRDGRWYLTAPPPVTSPRQAVVAYRAVVRPGPRYPYVAGTKAPVTFHLAHRSAR
jgi:hypothetical protein